MKRIHRLSGIAAVILLTSLSALAQQAGMRPAGRDLAANRLITFNGTLRDGKGQPQPGNIGITFSLYASQEGGSALWQESQSVQADEQGSYSVLLGATEREGLPLEVFNSGKAQWLGVQVQGEEEQPRILLVAVPYALKAADADTVGGRPLSSFVLYEDLTRTESAGTSRMIAARAGSAAATGRQVRGQNVNQGFQFDRLLMANGRISPFFGNETGSNTYYGENAGSSLTSGTSNSFFGQGSGQADTTGSWNSFFGGGAGKSNTNGHSNSYFGDSAGFYNTTGSGNSFFGQSAGESNTEGSANAFFGNTAGYSNTTGGSNSFFGHSAGNHNTEGEGNSFFGQGAGQTNTTGGSNAFFGQAAGFSSTTAANNSFFGAQAGTANSTGAGNAFFGWNSGSVNTTGMVNVFFGGNAGKSNTTACCNSFIGSLSGPNNTTGGYNTFLGRQTGSSNTTENNNTFVGALSDGAADITNATAVGYQAKVTQSNSLVLGSINGVNGATADTNVGIGTTAPTSRLTVVGDIESSTGFIIGGNKVFGIPGNNNTFTGSGAGNSNTTGFYNSFFGAAAGTVNTTGSDNSFFGVNAGSSNTTGYFNSFLGVAAGTLNTTGSLNSFFGQGAGNRSSTGTANSFYGDVACLLNTTGSYNSVFGFSAGSSNTEENNNSFFGAGSDGASGINNSTAIGYQAKVTQSNSLVLGSINGVNGATADTKVGIGTTAPISHLNVTSSSTVSPRGVTNEQYNNGMDGVQFRGRKSRGTPAVPAAIQAGDVLGNYVFDGHDGSAFGTGVQIRPVAEESWSPTAHGAYLALWTTPPGSTTNTEKLRITGSGNVGIGTSSPTEKFQVVGNVKISGTYLQGAPEEPVPDYVFEPGYRLMPIEELREFVQKERHLPDVPNAVEIKEKGLSLGDFQMKLLEKIEELTLYTVQQAKGLSEKDALIASLTVRLSALEQIVARMPHPERRSN